MFHGGAMAVKLILLVAALLPYIAAVSAKAGGKSFQNNTPRAWLADQEGWRARANAAQANCFESLPFFYAAFLYAFFNQADSSLLISLGFLWLVLRLVYILFYIKDLASLRSAIWAVALLVNVSFLFI